MHRYSMLVAVLSARYRNKLKSGKVKKKLEKNTSNETEWSQQVHNHNTTKRQNENKKINRSAEIVPEKHVSKTHVKRSKSRPETDNRRTNRWTDRQTRKYHNQYIVMISTKMTKQYKIKESAQINKVRTKNICTYK